MDILNDTARAQANDNDEKKAYVVELIKMAQDGSEEAFLSLRRYTIRLLRAGCQETPCTK